MAGVRQGIPLPASDQRPTWRIGPQVSRGGKLVDVEISGAAVENMTVVDLLTVDDLTIVDDLVVGDDASIDGDLAVAGNASVTGYITTLTSGSSITPDSWTAISLQNSWVDFGGSYGAARIRKGADGIVQVEGMIKSGTTTATTLIFQIPNGMRPGTQLMLPLADQAGLSAAYVTTSGGFRIQYGFTGTWTSITCSWAAA